MLFEFDLFDKVQKASWYDEFKTEVENRILETLSNSIYPKILILNPHMPMPEGLTNQEHGT